MVTFGAISEAIKSVISYAARKCSKMRLLFFVLVVTTVTAIPNTFLVLRQSFRETPCVLSHRW